MTVQNQSQPQTSVGRTTEVVTLENLRSISRSRVLGLGIATAVLGFVMVVIFGIQTDSELETTVQFGQVPSTAVPHLSLGLGIMVGIAGAALVTLAAAFLWRRSRFLAVIAGFFGLVLLLWPIALGLGFNTDAGQLRTATLPVSLTSYVLGGITLFGAAWLIVKRPDRGPYGVFLGAVGLFIFDFLIWVARGSNTASGPPTLQMTLIMVSCFLGAIPLIYGSLSGVVCERSGVVNIAIEGQFLVGAIVAEMVTSWIGPGLGGDATGIGAAALAGGIVGALLAVMALRYRADQVIVGVVIVAFCTALTSFLNASVLTPYANTLNVGPALPVLPIPFLSKIPILGPVMFNQNILVYLAFLLVAILQFGLFSTRWGLRVRSVGEKPRASETVGLSVPRIRYANVIMGGMIAGIGGASFTLGAGVPFAEGVTAGLGFIALAIMIFGRWRPLGALAGSLMFGFTIALGSQFQLYSSQFGVPSELINALPYIITIAIVAGLVGRVRAPAADGQPYSRE